MENVALVSIPYGKGKAGGTNKYMCGLNLTYQFPMGKVKSIAVAIVMLVGIVSIPYGKGKGWACSTP